MSTSPKYYTKEPTFKFTRELNLSNPHFYKAPTPSQISRIAKARTIVKKTPGRLDPSERRLRTIARLMANEQYRWGILGHIHNMNKRLHATVTMQRHFRGAKGRNKAAYEKAKRNFAPNKMRLFIVRNILESGGNVSNNTIKKLSNNNKEKLRRNFPNKF